MAKESNAESTVTAQQSACLEDVRSRFEEAWRRGGSPPIESFLPVEPSLRGRALLELVRADLESRCRNGQAVRVEEYLARYPELENSQAVLELVAAECRARSLDGSASLTEYQQRFPKLKDELAGHLEATIATLPSGPPKSTATDQLELDSVGAPTRYRILQAHAKGGLGQVFIALDQELHRHVALKEIQPEHAADPNNRGRFLLEAEITGNLEHPGVVPVYGLGQYGDGRPFYAMRFIKGDNLKEAIRQYHQSKDPQERRLALRQLLGRFIGVCNAVAYAHSRGVLHRDLKPGNIMLGKYGETLVVDWGLAKVVGRDEHAPRDESTLRLPNPRLKNASDSGDLATQLGETMGTPAYMSPEQAMGRHDLMGPASDIYSLGATMYHLLTGLPPCQDADVQRVLDKVRQGQMVPPRRVHRDIPRGLEAICLKAMALNPGVRYAAALDLAADIEHWLGDEPVSAYREPAWARVGRWARRHRAWVAAAAAILTIAALALSVSTVLIGLEKAEKEKAYEKAKTNFREAVKERKRAEDNFREAEKERQRAESNFQVAEKERQRAENNLQEAEKERKRAEEQKKLALDNAAQALASKKLAEQHGKQAQDNFQRAREAVDQMLTEIGQNWLADIPFMEPVRSKILEKALTFYEGFLKEKGSDPAVQEDAGRAYLRLADIYQRLGEEKKANDHYLQAIGLFQDLAKQFPKSPDYRKTLSLCHNNLGIMFANQGKNDDAIKAYQAALAIQEKLVEDAPDDPDFKASLAQTMLNLGNRLSVGNRKDEARKQHEQAFAIIQQVAGDFPDRTLFQQDLAGVYSAQALRLAAEGKPQAALDAHRQALKIRQNLVKLNPLRTDFRLELANSYHNQGIQLANMGKSPDAYDAYHQALDIRKRLAADHPLRPDFQQALGSSYHILGLRLTAMGKKTEAEESYRQALKIRSKLAGDFPTRPLYQSDLARTLNNLAFILEDLGYKTAALGAHRDGVAVNRKLTKNFPARLDFQEDLGKSLISLAFLCRDMKDYAESRKLLEEAVPHWQALLKAQPKNPKVSRSAKIAVSHLAETLLLMKDHAALARTAADLPRLSPESWQEQHKAARFFAQAATLVQADDKLTQEQRNSLAKTYADRTVQLLQQAVQKGFNNRQLLETDPRFDPVRSRDDFRKLLEQLKTN